MVCPFTYSTPPVHPVIRRNGNAERHLGSPTGLPRRNMQSYVATVQRIAQFWRGNIGLWAEQRRRMPWPRSIIIPSCTRVGRTAPAVLDSLPHDKGALMSEF